MKFKFLTLAIYITLLGCNSSNNAKTELAEETSRPLVTLDGYSAGLEVPDNRSVQEYKVLFFGNSHIANIPSILTKITEQALPDKKIKTQRAPNSHYLSERLNDSQSAEMLQNEEWSHVILQAQKYSQSGAVEYPTTAAQTWIRMAKSLGTMPILYPEHPQRGKSQEGQRVHQIHVNIANKEASCVAPVGLVWDKVILLVPSIKLHDNDGNHATYTGQVLTAFVMFEMVTGYSADLLPYIEGLDVEYSIQSLFGQVASGVIAEHKTCLQQ